MGELFNRLCKGPVVIVDDEVNKPGSVIALFLKEIEKQNLPVLKYEKLESAIKELKGMVFSNFVILDWMFKKTSDDELLEGVQTGDAEKTIQDDDKITFIKELQKVCLAPVFVISNMGKSDIRDILENAGILKDKNNYVFVQDKSELDSSGKLIHQIEKWIKESPHVYLAKWWTNEWLTKNTSVFWDLYHSAPNWPALLYKTLKRDGSEPVMGLIDMLFQLIYSEINTASIDESQIGKRIKKVEFESLKSLYKRLIYTKNDIDKNIKPGDIFEEVEGDGTYSYYLNIRPECDTTNRVQTDHDLYLIKGNAPKNKRKDIKYTRQFGVIEKENQIILHFIGKYDTIIFDKRKLSKKNYSKLRSKKICRIVHPYITKIRQSFASYIGRFGTPAYPRELLDEIFKVKSAGEKN